ncbi:transcription regulator ArsR [Actinoplanes friuliensis DSM 7358]|uniref:Transcription regulator ArsR n=1 Tax=Actinoplanes friuliensis DSM 7358 TaxID=1246995 RepID=U5W532_9ACTN|nr:transcription regulator ArsR [Actinoplanes friuliensis DSM 7358]
MTAPALARLATLLADTTRASFCLALLDGRAWTAGELAGHAGVAPATATEHLHKLVAAGLLTEHRQGRHRYVRLADERVAHLIEDLAAHLSPPPAPPRTLRAATVSAALARGRTCYDHLAGRLGVAVTDALDRGGLLSRTAGFTLTPAGVTWFEAFGPLGPSRRPAARGCLDWTERREHLAGAAGALLCRHFLDQGWVTRIGTGRAIRVTPPGTEALTDLLGPDPAWTSPADGAVAVRVGAGRAGLVDGGQGDDGVGALGDGLVAGVAVEVGGRVARVDHVDADAGEELGVHEGEHVDRGLAGGIAE